MKLAIIGGGGFRVPLVYRALLAIAVRVDIDELVLHDIDPDRLGRVSAVLTGLSSEHSQGLPVRTTTDLRDAVEGADFVFCAIRVGGLEGRVADESVPLSHGVLGQETVGPGGICFALRTIPVMIDIAETIAALAPQAWLINFTNPAGMVTEAVQQVLGERVIGVCDSPAGLCKRVAAALGLDPSELWFDYFGLNHLGWLKAVRDGACNLLPDLLADDARLMTFAEGRLFNGGWLRSLGMIPNEYLYYLYNADAAVQASRAGGQSRGHYLLQQQGDFYAARDHSTADALAAWRAVLYDRDRTYMGGARVLSAGTVGRGAADNGGYEGEAVAIVQALALNTRSVLILNTANRSSVPFLDDRAVVEVPAIVGRAGPIPTAVGSVPAHARALIETIKEVERRTIDAALTRSREQAIAALALHPVVPSVAVAGAIFAGYQSRHAYLREAFAG